MTTLHHPVCNRVRFEVGAAPQPGELMRLFVQTTWAAQRTEADIAVMLQHCTLCVTVRDGSELIGFGRAITDGKYRALLDDIVVAEDRRDRGIGAAIVESLLKQLAEVEEVFLNTDESLRDFYERLGFRPFKGLTMVRRMSSRKEPS